MTSYRARIVAVEFVQALVAISRKLGAAMLIPARVYATERGTMDINWTHAAPTVLAAFLASASSSLWKRLRVVLAVAASCAVGEAQLAALALVVLLLLVVVLGPVITQIPETYVQLILGTLLLLFGMRWLLESCPSGAAGVVPLRYGRWKKLHMPRKAASLRAKGVFTRGWDRVAVSTAFKITMIEGIEVVFIVVAVGASGRGLSRSPRAWERFGCTVTGRSARRDATSSCCNDLENTLKFLVGILLRSFGTFWVGEGMAMSWPGGDVSLAVLNVGYLAAGLMLRAPMPRKGSSERCERSAMNVLRAILNELAGLFVDDSSLAALVLAWLAVCWLSLPKLSLPSPLLLVLLFVGLAAILAESTVRRAGER